MAVYNPPAYKPGPNLRPAPSRIHRPLPSGKVRWFPAGPDYESLMRGSREVTLLVVKRPKRPLWVRVRYYHNTTRLAERVVWDHFDARAEAKSYLASGRIPDEY